MLALEVLEVGILMILYKVSVLSVSLDLGSTCVGKS